MCMKWRNVWRSSCCFVWQETVFFPGPPNLATVLSSECVSVGWHESGHLRDDSIPLWLRLAVLRDGPGTLPFSSLPSYLSLLRSIWEGWRRKHPLTTWDLCCFACAYTTGSRHFTLHFTDSVHSTLDRFDQQHFAEDEENTLPSPARASPAQEVVEEGFVGSNQETALSFWGHDCVSFNGFQRCFVHDVFEKTCELKFSI